MSKGYSKTNFVHRQNIERFGRLLQTPLDAERRRIILWLLSQEEAAVREAREAGEEHSEFGMASA